jgi:hypothetical protein
VSEYQYYEFQAIDRALGPKQMAYLRGYSTRATITPTSFVNHYEWGDFKGDEDAWMDRFFDAFLYTANWGTNILKLRVPNKCLSLASARAFRAAGTVDVRQKLGNTIITLTSDDETGDWDGDHPTLASMISIRNELARGDLRALYLGWLAAAQQGEVEDDIVEPPVPAGLGQLDASHNALVAFLRIDKGLLRTAARESAPLAPPPKRRSLVAWIKGLPAPEKDDILVRILTDGSHAAAELRDRFSAEHRTQPRDTARSSRRRTVRDLVSRPRRA